MTRYGIWLIFLSLSVLRGADQEEIKYVFSELKPSDPENAFDNIVGLKRSIAGFKRKYCKNPEKIDLYIDAYANDMFTGRLSQLGRHSNCVAEFQRLMNVYSDVFGTDMKVSFAKVAQNSALATRNIECVKGIYETYIKLLTNEKRSFKNRKNSATCWDRDTATAVEFTKDLKNNPNSYRTAMDELLKEAPQGIDEVLRFCAEQLQTRMTALNNSFERTKSKISEDSAKNELYVNLAMALTQKKMFMSMLLRNLIEIKKTKDEREKRNFMAMLAVSIVWSRFTGKMPGEWLELLNEWEPLSPTWLYAHQHLDRLFLRFEGIPEIGTVVQTQAFLEGVILSRVIMALRRECSEPVKSYLPWLICDVSEDEDLSGIHLIREKFTKRLSYVGDLTQKNKLDSRFAHMIINHSIPNALQVCSEELKTRMYFDLTADELASLTSDTVEVEEPFDFWLDEEPKTSKKRGKKRSKRSMTFTSDLGKIKEERVSSLDALSSDSLTSDGPSLNVDSSSTQSDLPSSDESTISCHSTTNDESKEEPRVKVDMATLVAKRYIIDVERDIDAIQEEMIEYEDSIKKFKAQKEMEKYTYDALKDVGKTAQLVQPPQSYITSVHKIVFLSTEDICALIPEASTVSDRNVYLDTPNLALSDSKIKLQWIFDESIIIGQDEYLFLCQVFNLIRGSNYLSFDKFLKTVQRLTKASTKLDVSKTVFRFNHAFLIDGQVCLPPINGVHREHESSGFNHIQVKKFLMHGGAHPYFFRIIESKYNTQ